MKKQNREVSVKEHNKEKAPINAWDTIIPVLRYTGISTLWASEDGRIFRFITYNDGRIVFKELKQQINKTSNGLRKICTTTKDYRSCPYVHKLVAMAWLDNPDPKKYQVVIHRDGDPANNYAGNLMWIEKKAKPKGYRKYDPVVDIFTGEVWDSITECAEDLDVGRTTVIRSLKLGTSFTDSWYGREHKILRLPEAAFQYCKED